LVRSSRFPHLPFTETLCCNDTARYHTRDGYGDGYPSMPRASGCSAGGPARSRPARNGAGLPPRTVTPCGLPTCARAGHRSAGSGQRKSSPLFLLRADRRSAGSSSDCLRTAILSPYCFPARRCTGTTLAFFAGWKLRDARRRSRCCRPRGAHPRSWPEPSVGVQGPQVR
jgi:hypothetical protein